MTYVALIGLTLIVTRGAIFARLQRLWPPLFRCSQCFGMWVGLGAGACGLASFDQGRPVDAILVGAATSVLSMGVDAILLRLLGDPEGD